MRLRWRALPKTSRLAAAIGIVALAVIVAGAWFDRAAFFQAWLVAWLFVLGISLGAMMNVMIHELTGGDWGAVLRPPLEAAMLALPFCALLAIPLAFGAPELFAWAHADVVAASQTLQAKRWFLNVPSFLARNAAWVATWCLFAVALGRRLAMRDAAARLASRRISVAGLLVYLFTVTLFAYDWIASLVPEWSSTALGVRLGSSQFLAALSFTVVFVAWAPRRLRTGSDPTARDLQDFGNLLLTYAMFWAYIAYMQFFIIWGEDLPRETSWYWPHLQTSWRWLAIGVFALEFALPFSAMLFRRVKRDRRALAIVCALVLAGQWLDTVWLTAPSLRTAGFALHWQDLVALVALGALWLAVVTTIVSRLPAPRLRAGSERVSAHG